MVNWSPGDAFEQTATCVQAHTHRAEYRKYQSKCLGQMSPSSIWKKQRNRCYFWLGNVTCSQLKASSRWPFPKVLSLAFRWPTGTQAFLLYDYNENKRTCHQNTETLRGLVLSQFKVAHFFRSTMKMPAWWRRSLRSGKDDCVYENEYTVANLHIDEIHLTLTVLVGTILNGNSCVIKPRLSRTFIRQFIGPLFSISQHHRGGYVPPSLCRHAISFASV